MLESVGQPFNEVVYYDETIQNFLKLKERILQVSIPKITFDLINGKFEYVIENDQIKHIDNLIKDRMEFLKNTTKNK